MLKKRRHYSAQFKFQVALEAVIGMKTISQLAAEHQDQHGRTRPGVRQHLHRATLAQCQI